MASRSPRSIVLARHDLTKTAWDRGDYDLCIPFIDSGAKPTTENAGADSKRQPSLAARRSTERIAGSKGANVAKTFSNRGPDLRDAKDGVRCRDCRRLFPGKVFPGGVLLAGRCPDCHSKWWQRERDRRQRQAPETRSVGEPSRFNSPLDILLAKLAKNDDKLIAGAREKLRIAIEDYREYKPPDTKKTRASLDTLRKRLTGARAALGLPLEARMLTTARAALGLPLEARKLFGHLFGPIGPLQAALDFGPIGARKAALDKAVRAAEQAHALAMEVPDRQPHYNRALLAFDVARTLRDVLKKRPTMTRDDLQTRPGARGGAAYARLLREVLAMVGVVRRDISREMKDGLDLLNELRKIEGPQRN